MKKVIGIIGGMGPLATVDLFKKIVSMTKADSDQEHLRVCIDSNTDIPDRTKAILHGGIDPVDEILRSAQRLESAGADVLIMPCNTAHYFYDRLTAATSLPILNMLEETAKEIVRQGIGTVGLLATDGTIQSGVYDHILQKYEIKVLKPSDEDQRHIMDIIYKGVKASNAQLDITGFLHALDKLEAAGAEALVLGCTELPIAFVMFDIKKKVVDPTAVLASAAILFAGGEIRKSE